MKFLKKWWLTVIFISLVIILMAAIIIPTSLTSRRALTSLAHEIMMNITAYTLDKSESYLRPAEKAAELTRFLADSHIVSSESPEEMINYFYQQLALYNQFTSVYYGNISGEFFMASRSKTKGTNEFYTKIIQIKDNVRKCTLKWTSSDHSLLKEVVDPEDSFDPRRRPWFIDAVMNNDVVWTAPYLFYTGKKPGITTASPVYNESGALQGVVGVDISIEELSIFLSKLKIGQRGRAFIVNTSGDVVAFPDLSDLRRTTQDTNKLRLSKISDLKDTVSKKAFASLKLAPQELPEKSVFTSFMHNGERYSAMFTPFKKSQWPWVIGIYIPENDYLGEIKEAKDMSILVALLAVLLTGTAGWTVAKKFEISKKNAVSASKAKSQFLAVMSHEIRTPMNVILGAMDLLRKTRTDENQAKYIGLLGNASEGLLTLVNDILDISKVESGLMELEIIKFNPAQVVQQSCDVFAISAHTKNIELKLDVAEGFPVNAMGDPVRMKQIMINLIGNAIKFTSEGGVYVHAKTVKSNRRKQIKTVISVTDTGPGISEDQHSIIFDRFTQANNSTTHEHQGSGLGLAISKSLSKLMGGDIKLTSSSSKGSTFVFTANLLKETVNETALHENMLEKEYTEPRKVLLVEDNKNNQMLFRHFLQNSGHVIFIAENGQDAIDKYIEINPDIIFMDIEMPVMNGYDATRKIREIERKSGKPTIPIIALTAHAIKGTEKSVKEAGCSGYMSKPVTQLQLIDRIERRR